MVIIYFLGTDIEEDILCVGHVFLSCLDNEHDQNMCQTCAMLVFVSDMMTWDTKACLDVTGFLVYVFCTFP